MQRGFLFIYWLLLCGNAGAQVAEQPPFYADIQAFKVQDSMAMPPKGKVLFVGSSSFTLWHTVQASFPAVPILNRAFGGSALTDLIRYHAEVIFPYAPSKIVIYCGENDFAANESLHPSLVTARFVTLFGLIRKQLPQVPVVYVSMKPSPSRRHLMAKFEAANEEIRAFLKKQPRTNFVDVYHAMLDKQGNPLPALFIADSLHMSTAGYAIWQQKLRRVIQ